MKAFGTISLVGAALAAVMAVASCSSSNSSSPTPSGAGESCTRTSDCQSGLVCLGNTCVAKGGVTVIVDAGQVDADAGEAGGNPVATRLGTTCASTAECGDPTLVCVPTALGGVKGGLCDLASYGITPTQKVCGECAADSDCCELPYNFSEIAPIEVANDAGQFFVVRTCDDLKNFAIGGNTGVCGTATDPTLVTACNFYTHYCNGCVIDGWTCSSGQCMYTGPCAAGTSSLPTVWNSCPTLTRSGRPLALTCVGGDGGKTPSCQTGNCQTSADCVGVVPTDLNGSPSACEGNDCVCFQNSCFFQCVSDLDCPGGYTCDSTSKVCTFSGCQPGPSADQTCKVQLADARAVCRQVTATTPGNCAIPCASDHDCSVFSGAIPGTTFSPAEVCGADGFCASAVGGCSTNADCRTQISPTNGFCVPPPAPSQVHSAIANH